MKWKMDEQAETSKTQWSWMDDNDMLCVCVCGDDYEHGDFQMSIRLKEKWPGPRNDYDTCMKYDFSVTKMFNKRTFIVFFSLSSPPFCLANYYFFVCESFVSIFLHTCLVLIISSAQVRAFSHTIFVCT